MTAMRDIPGLLLTCSSCDVVGTLSEFSDFANTDVPLIQCRKCGGQAKVLCEPANSIDPARRFQFGMGWMTTKAWRDFERDQ